MIDMSDNRKITYIFEIIFKHKNGFEIPVILEAIPILFDPDLGVVKQVIGVVVDQTERKQFESDIFKLNRELQALSRTDSLTGLANRRKNTLLQTKYASFLIDDRH